MKLARALVLINVGDYDEQASCVAALAEVRGAIADVVWPPGSDIFTIHPESGRKPGMGNGVGPVRAAFVLALEDRGWKKEVAFPLATDPYGAEFGKMDAAKEFDDGLPFLVEWKPATFLRVIAR